MRYQTTQAFVWYFRSTSILSVVHIHFIYSPGIQLGLVLFHMMEKQNQGLPISQKNSDLNSVAHLYNLARNLKSCCDTATQWFSISIISSVYEKHFNSILTIFFMINKAEVPIARLAILPQ